MGEERGLLRYSRGGRASLVRITRKLKILRLCAEILKSPFAKLQSSRVFASALCVCSKIFNPERSTTTNTNKNVLMRFVLFTRRARLSRGSIILINFNRGSSLCRRRRQRRIARNKNIRRRIGRRVGMIY